MREQKKQSGFQGRVGTMKLVISRPMEFELWKSGERYILSVTVDHGVVSEGLNIVLGPREADSLLGNMAYLELKVKAMRENPALFADEAVDLKNFE